MKKKSIIEKLFPHLDENRRRFWSEMPENNESKDLSTERDDAEFD